MHRINMQKVSEMFSGGGSDIYKKCEDTVNKYNMRSLIESGVLIGFSGGPDSVMLLLFLLEYKRRNSIDSAIHCIHINHGIREDEATRDEIFSEDFCHSLNVSFEKRFFSVPTMAKNDGTGIEETARYVRYYTFNRIISGRNDLNSIAVAHNMSDNVETVLFNMLRGSGARGGGGIRPVRDNIIRPLIKVKKADIISVLTEYNISFVTDSTNLSTDYTRNYIRHEIVPKFNKISSDPEMMISRFSDHLSSDDEYIYEVANKHLNGRKHINIDELRQMHYSVFVRTISIMASNCGASVSAKICNDIFGLLSKDNFCYSIIGANFICERGDCFVSRNYGSLVDYCYEINEGTTKIELLNADFILSKQKVEKSYLNVYSSSIQANISSAIINGGLYVRPKKDGDTIYYGGMTHKLKKLFNDKKIPISMRKLIPILCDESGVVWVPGFGVRDDGVTKDNREDLFVAIGISNNKD